jgi:hypothetical protein
MVVAETSGAVSPSSGWTAPTSFVASMLMVAIGCGEASAPHSLPIAGRPVRLYVAAGQSNMVGFGAFADSRHRLPHPLVMYQYRAGAGAGLGRPRALPRFFRHGTIRQGLDCFRDRGVGPWWAFARALVDERDDDEVRVLMVAVNGSTLHDWTRDGGLLDESLALIREATSDGAKLEGVIWHHGESGPGEAGGDYGEMLGTLVRRLRSGTGETRLPFVAGTLPESSPNAQEVNTALRQLASVCPDCVVVDLGAYTLSDAVHLDTSASERLGVAMADAMVESRAAKADRAVP